MADILFWPGKTTGTAQITLEAGTYEIIPPSAATGVTIKHTRRNDGQIAPDGANQFTVVDGPHVISLPAKHCRIIRIK